MLEETGMRVLRCGGVGSLAGLCEHEVLAYVLRNEPLLPPFLDLCEYYDREVLPDGPGTRQRAGLLAVAERPD